MLCLIIKLKEGAGLGIKELYELEQFFKRILNTEKTDMINQKGLRPFGS